MRLIASYSQFVASHYITFFIIEFDTEIFGEKKLNVIF